MDTVSQINELFVRMEKASLPLRSESPFVPGDGDPTSGIVFIGEAAGFHEAQEKKPFVGRSGKLLTETMTANGIKRQDVWITNVVKARPPENRDPLPAEVEAYRPYLEEELKIIQPKVIVTLGRFALNWFLPDDKISYVHGSLRTASTGQKIFPMFHPSAALRAPDMMRSFQADFVAFGKLYRELLQIPEQTTSPGKTEAENEKPVEQFSLF